MAKYGGSLAEVKRVITLKKQATSARNKKVAQALLALTIASSIKALKTLAIAAGPLDSLPLAAVQCVRQKLYIESYLWKKLS